ncbi:hypothetical protein SAMN03159463_00090 [Mesorhizobium sp. NFR06]|nr:hypothetical protein SAMN03159463_00090 [Mesorhizobium sp. NFR06]
MEISKMSNVGGTAPPSALPGISPTRGEIDVTSAFANHPTLLDERGAQTANLPPSGGDVRQDRGGREGTRLGKPARSARV